MDPLTTGLLIGFALGLVVGLVVPKVFASARTDAARSGRGGAVDNDFARLIGSGKAGASPAASSGMSDELAQLKQDLRLKFLHDEQRMKDAVELERQRNPHGSEVELYKAAIYRWERDNS